MPFLRNTFSNALSRTVAENTGLIFGICRRRRILLAGFIIIYIKWRAEK